MCVNYKKGQRFLTGNCQFEERPTHKSHDHETVFCDQNQFAVNISEKKTVCKGSVVVVNLVEVIFFLLSKKYV